MPVRHYNVLYPLQTDFLKVWTWAWNFVWRFVMVFESLMQKMKKMFFSIIYLLYFFSKSNFNSKFCVELDNAIEKLYAKKWRKTIDDILIYAKFSYKSAPKPVGRIDPRMFERVKLNSLYLPHTRLEYIFNIIQPSSQCYN